MWKIFYSERSVNKIFFFRWYFFNIGFYGVIVKFIVDENFLRGVRLKKKYVVFLYFWECS